MKALPHWVLWRLETPKGAKKPTKPPYSARTGKHASSTDPKTWTSFSEAVAAYERGGYSGIGFMFEGSPFVGIDIDHIVDPEKGIDPRVFEVVNHFESYAEFSQSGEGVHIIVEGKLPPGDRKREPFEMYGNGSPRYFAMTGDLFGDTREIKACQAKIDETHAKYIGGPKQPQQTTITTAPAATPLLGFELLDKARKAKDGQAFTALYDHGDTGPYGGDESRADQALCNKLAFWTGKDPGRMDELFRASALMRPKWDEKRGAQTYGQITIETAIRDCTAIYSPKSPEFQQKRREQAKKDFKAAGKLDINPLDDQERYSFNDRGNGYLFADTFQNVNRYCPEVREWYTYDGKLWRKDTGAVSARENAKALSVYLFGLIPSIGEDAAREPFKKNALGLSSIRPREAMLKDAQTVYPLRVSELDGDPNLFNCKNGTLRLDTLELLPHSPADNLSMMGDVNYKPGAVCERWLRFIEEITEGDEGRARFLQKALGYSLQGSSVEECLFLLYGPLTRNGKGTFIYAILKVFGTYAKTASPETLAVQKNPNGRGPSEDVARLRGARLVSISEPGKNMHFDEGKLKHLTGRDVVTARFLNEGSFEYTPQYVIFINSNHQPTISDDTVFSSGRMKVIPFNRHFAAHEQDKNLKQQLIKAEALSGIFNWVLDGLALYRAEGLGISESVEGATVAYRKESDKIAQFMAECTQPAEAGIMPIKTLYKAYQTWCQEGGFRYPSQTKLTQSLKAKNYPIETGRYYGSNFEPHIFGVSLAPQGLQDFHTG